MAGPAGAPHFPVPWASVAEGSHLLPPEAVRDAVDATGLRQRQWRDLTAEAKAWSEKAAAAQASTKVPSGQALIPGPDFAALIANLRRTLRADPIAVVQAAFDKAGRRRDRKAVTSGKSLAVSFAPGCSRL